MPQARSRRLWEASDSDRSPVCSNEHLGGGGGLGGGGLQAATNRVRVQRAWQYVQHLQDLTAKQHHTNSNPQVSHSNCFIDMLLQAATCLGGGGGLEGGGGLQAARCGVQTDQ